MQENQACLSSSHEIAASHVRCTSRGRCYMRQREVEGRMSRLHLRKRSGKVVLERPEGVAPCLSFRLTSCAEGVQHLFSWLHEFHL